MDSTEKEGVTTGIPASSTLTERSVRHVHFKPVQTVYRDRMRSVTVQQAAAIIARNNPTHRQQISARVKRSHVVFYKLKGAAPTDPCRPRGQTGMCIPFVVSLRCALLLQVPRACIGNYC